MLARTYTATIRGLTPIKIEVEVVSTRGTPNLIIIGLPGRAVEEAKERITAALLKCGIRIRSRRTIVNLAPADISKNDSVFELAIAVGMMKMYGEIKINTAHTIFFGELSLNGELKPIRGALPLVLAAQQMGFKKIVLPAQNATEVAMVQQLTIHPLQHLQEFINYARGQASLPILTPRQLDLSQAAAERLDYADIHGQVGAKRALEIAAAGGHNLLMIGPPGAGKSLLAKTLPTILPPLTTAEALEINSIYSIAGLNNQQFLTHRPFRAPHHTISKAGLVGGGPRLLPGELSLSHRGVLFMDELTEFSSPLLETLRQPLEDSQITITRAAGSQTFPAAFTLVSAANPCRCGWYGSAAHACRCSPFQLQQYQQKLSGPILDRIDLIINIKPISLQQLTLSSATAQSSSSESSAVIRTRVIAARNMQTLALAKTGVLTNAELSSKQCRQLLKLVPAAHKLLIKAAAELQLSARSYYKVMKVSQTIAQLAGEKLIQTDHLAEALQYRAR